MALLRTNNTPFLEGDPKRRKDLQDHCRDIDFRRVRLLDDTVTEAILSFDLAPQGPKLPYKTETQLDQATNTPLPSNIFGFIPGKTRFEYDSRVSMAAVDIN